MLIMSLECLKNHKCPQALFMPNTLETFGNDFLLTEVTTVVWLHNTDVEGKKLQVGWQENLQLEVIWEVDNLPEENCT